MKQPRDIWRGLLLILLKFTAAFAILEIKLAMYEEVFVC